MRIPTLRQRLRDLGCKPCHEDRLLRGWSQVRSYDIKGSPAEMFFPVAMRNELAAIEAELNGLARLRGEYPIAPSPALPRNAGEGVNMEVARLLVELHDGQMVESVLLPRGGLCVSTQVGCAVGCVFCMSGKNGLLRQLGSAEIVAQVVLARRRRAVSKVVFMGMGEPAHNLDNVLEAIEVLGRYGNIGHKELVLSTVGDVRVFERLMENLPHSSKPSLQPSGKTTNQSTQPASRQVAGYPASGESGARGAEPGNREVQSSIFMVRPALAISLHSTDATLRAKLLPRAPEIAIDELVERGERYARATGYPVQYQWTLIGGINDSDGEVDGIVRLLSGKYAVMNFIPFNAVDGLTYRRPSSERIAAMVYTLKQHGILAKIRDSAGQEIEGACGQLRARAVKAK